MSRKQYTPRTAVLRLRIDDATVFEARAEADQGRRLLHALRRTREEAAKLAEKQEPFDEDMIDALIAALHLTYGV